MKTWLHRFILSLALVLVSHSAFAALPNDGVWEVRSTATAGNLNGGGFNPSNANFYTDGAATSGTGNASLFSSASYPFVSRDIGHKVFIKTGTDWYSSCWYNIADVSGGVAELDSAIGEGVCRDANTRFFAASTVAGVASTASPSGATWGIDYSQNNAALTNCASATDLVVVTTTTLTSVACPFSPEQVGNILHITAGTATKGWYEIVSVAAGVATIDRSATTTGTGNTFSLGGAISLGATGTGVGDTAFSAAPTAGTSAGSRIFVKGPATYTLGQAWTGGTGSTWPLIWEGYTSTRGDRPSIASGNQPTLAAGSNSFVGSGGTNEETYNISFTTSHTNGIQQGSGNATNIGHKCFYCKVRGTGTGDAATGGSYYFSDIMGGADDGYVGTGNSNQIMLYGNYIHDSASGVNMTASSTLVFHVVNNLFVANSQNGLKSIINGPQYIIGNTFYNGDTASGDCLAFTNSAAWKIIALNNIIYGCVQGVEASTLANSITPYADYNDYYNNTTDVDSAVDWQKGTHSLAVDPGFSNLVIRKGSTATTTAGNHLVQSGATFQTWGIAAGDFLNILSTSGSGPTKGGYKISSVDSETQVTVDTTLTANATADKVWQIIPQSSRNFSIGTNLKAAAFPGLFQGSVTTSYMDIGAVQRQESSGGSCSAGN